MIKQWFTQRGLGIICTMALATLLADAHGVEDFWTRTFIGMLAGAAYMVLYDARSEA